jgi:hypothetical protein
MTDLANILFLDIETVRGYDAYTDMPEALRLCWDGKAGQLAKREEGDPAPEELFHDKAGIYCEFGKIVCISVGIFRREKDGSLQLRVKSFFSDDEKVLLEEFSGLLNQYFNDPSKHFLCGHNIKEFDAPYICRRMVINGLPLPKLLDLSGKKPWETRILDTMEMWSFGDKKAFTSLKLLCAVFGIPTPKDDIDGSDVGRVYWEERDLDRIERYCRKDVAATAQVFLRMRLQPLLTPEQIHGLS